MSNNSSKHLLSLKENSFTLCSLQILYQSRSSHHPFIPSNVFSQCHCWVWGKYCTVVFDSPPKNMVFKKRVQGSYWTALILRLLGCLWKWLFGVKNILSKVSSTKCNSADTPNPSPRETLFHMKFSFYFLKYGLQVSWLSSEKHVHPKNTLQWDVLLDSTNIPNWRSNIILY